MKTVCKRLGSGLLALMLLSTAMLSTCSATSKASDFFSSTEVVCYAKGSGKVMLEYDIDATGIMDALGIYYATFYEKQPNGKYISVKTYNWDNVDGLTTSNTSTAGGTLWYQGVAGRSYYAVVGCYAELGSKSSILPQTTRTITAT